MICLHSFGVHFERVDFEDTYIYKTFSFYKVYRTILLLLFSCYVSITEL